MKNQTRLSSLILVLEDVEETRDGIENLLNADGYRVDPARNEIEAITKARREAPDLILVSFGRSSTSAVAVGCGVRERAGLDSTVPVVIFCVETLVEGAEVELGENVFVTRPDNFDQLRALLRTLISYPPAAL